MTLIYSLMVDTIDIITVSILTVVSILIGRFAYHVRFSFSCQHRVWSILLKCLIFSLLQLPIVVSYFTFFTPSSTIFVWIGLVLAVAVVFGMIKLNIFSNVQPTCLANNNPYLEHLPKTAFIHANLPPNNNPYLEHLPKTAFIHANPRKQPNFLNCLYGLCPETIDKDDCFGTLQPKLFVRRNNNRIFGPMQPFTHIPNDRVFGPNQYDPVSPINRAKQPRIQKRQQRQKTQPQAPVNVVCFQKQSPCANPMDATYHPNPRAQVVDVQPCVNPVNTPHQPTPSVHVVDSKNETPHSPSSSNSIKPVEAAASPMTQNVIVNQKIHSKKTIDVTDIQQPRSRSLSPPLAPSSLTKEDSSNA